ncbi:MAG: hypothetical protein A3F18_07020 [Legionellales bacterium RIFCSPHIGHO2_12_FULL_37_14]|nr:MAG: hypothetical protein A3F18_07020 [Legionellales bacterium RIFCSPHIGHO2_12_FULL_37_14]
MLKATFDKNWFMSIRTSTAAEVNLICFPCGGGGASTFCSWQSLAAKVNIWALKLPGRESRMTEAPLTSATTLIKYIIDALSPTLTMPFIFYGHSMGAGLAFQVILQLQKSKQSLPKLLIASGREPPHCNYSHSVSHLEDHALIAYLQELGGISGTIPNDKIFIKQYLTKIRADYQLNSSIPNVTPMPLPIMISIINGYDDPLVKAEKLPQWAKHTNYSLHSRMLPGGHFFINEYFSDFINEVAISIRRT